MLQILLLAIFLSLLVGMCLIHFSHLHERFSADHDLGGVQKFHARPVPRIGGVPMAAGLVAGCGLLAWSQRDALPLLFLVVALPAFAAGMLEDVTKQVGPLPRLLATFVAAILGYFMLGAGLQRLDIPVVDGLLSQFWALSLLLTVVAVGGVAHAVNIIDGYNGLSGVVSIFIFLAMAYAAFKVQDTALMGVCFAMVGAIAGFLFWNFPRGLIFAGDGGAYLVGFMIAEVSVLLVARHEQISPWFPLLCVIYPVFETVFSIYRRKFLQGRRIGYPDALHLHQLVYMRLVRWMVGSKDVDHKTMRNSLTSPYLWALSSVSVVPAMLFWNNTPVLIGFVLAFMVTYVKLYRMIIRFRTPRWMLLRKSAR
ncbi:glycosyltransferase family 4 protein [Chromobacterium haemolyticum]|uniref:Glycosyltransferase family 4 protein n=1 Tax=Chromobacterium haemolyticum TaxID=394935 RepID=A0ABS3GTH9_9NEIS|nr:glycosyltransferase [Chromobacterium haemolyticum]MBK0417259.1 glycosyltransferase family 4 protein [Chromobacterium haemolyticum]MBO0418360.1 glycosyltransferase family 4 protein [Chromobacterium haemolyticum]MBO0501709.1 glycosyltransferase family 4 protein [Chromobacterium haemolyticum]OQS35200.1 glycosyl transferase [Chromobacterium haemolyticum]BBH14695.1 glycosyl transferase [Chromobacterium haemolyticum]